MSDQRIAPTMGLRELAMRLALSVLWSGSFFFFKVVVAELSTFTAVLGRVELPDVLSRSPAAAAVLGANAGLGSKRVLRKSAGYRILG